MRMQNYIVGLCAISVLLPTLACAEELPRVASIEHCMDQYVMELADPEQIVSLSNVSRAPSVSFHAKYAQDHKFPRNFGHAEEILPLQPDVVLAGFYWKDTQDFLRDKGVQVETVYPPRSIDDVKSQVRRIAKALHQVDRGNQLIARIEKAVENARPLLPSAPEAVVYYSGGYTMGDGTYFNDLLQTSGFRNGAKGQGIRGPGYLSLEHMVLMRPDMVLEDHGSRKRADRVAATLMDHPALRRAIPNARRQHLPSQLWLCGGEATIAVLNYFQDVRLSYVEHTP